MLKLTGVTHNVRAYVGVLSLFVADERNRTCSVGLVSATRKLNSQALPVLNAVMCVLALIGAISLA